MIKLDTSDDREIDDKRTRDNVAYWFDTEYERYQRLANLPLLPSSALSLAPSRGTAHANSVEDRTVTRANAKQVLEFIDAVLDALDELHKKIIVGCFIDHLKGWKVAEMVGYSTTRFNELKIISAVEFAQMLDISAGTQLTAYKAEE